MFNGLVKHDTLTGREERYEFEPGVFCSELGVAPRVGGTEEDDAYLVTLTVDMNCDLSECVVFRANDVGRGPIARAQLPERIASGTHSCWAPLGESGRTAPGLTMSRRVPKTSDNTEAPDNAAPDTAASDTTGAPESGPAGENSNAIALGLIGDEWNLTIIRLAIMSGVRRYKDFRDRLGIANSVLTVRLRRLTEAGVFTMSQYSQAPRRHEYVLTERGRDLWKVLLTIWSWEAVWVTEHIEPLPPMYHTECGEEFSPVMHCRACGQPAGIRDVRGTFGPSGGFARSVPRATTRRRSAGGSPGPGLVPQTIELIGNRWSASALAAAFLGARRFTDMLVMMGAPPTIVSDRLRTFCQMGVLETAAAKAGSGRVEYRLTDKGRA
ncbi:MAG: winged helix-turn-helix transcriptional regulator, partial [Gemmatimonadales bacterium]